MSVSMMVVMCSQAAQPSIPAQSTVRLILPHDQDTELRFIPRFEALYQQLDYQIEWVSIPLERGVIELTKGNVDGLMFAPEMQPSETAPYVLIRSLATEKSIYLICFRQEVCSDTALFEPGTHFLAPTIADFFIRKQQYTARPYYIEELSTYHSLMLKGRFRFAIADGVTLPSLFNTPEFSAYTLQTYAYFHAVRSNHTELIEALSKMTLPTLVPATTQ
ncbi:hypothetical protein [Alteromonas oceanisediminis]|uniref:hypothetical protein n=1 Tax=Alteromonas oceanisediminis TaxID=2836180 RepID=UPI001BDAC65A|nr:hypothetical protein [Alteromonas oceanisediminis]MBT0585423.1 hypothetical protein [Alteromonas oceanisediminis]